MVGGWRLVVLLGALAGAAASADESAEQAAGRIAEAAGFHGGLAVHVGCGDGRLTIALRRSDRCVVQGLDPDPANVERARAEIRSCDLYGPVSVARWDGPRLPYVDNLASLVVCENPGAVAMDELFRVVRPLGAVVTRRDGQWTATVKPRPENADEWEQHFRGPDNNAVARDTLVGPPRRFQWIAKPQWQRSHLAMPSINSLVSAGGRLFSIEDFGSAEHPALPGKFALVARDAYNGIVLWTVAFPDWHPIYIRDKETPVQIQRRLAAVGDAVYATPGYAAPITVFDAATGAVRCRMAGTTGTVEFVHEGDTVFAVTGDPFDVSPALEDASSSALKTSLFPLAAYGPRIRRAANPKNDIVALDATSGAERWRKSGPDTRGYQGGSLGVSGDRVVYATASELVCLDRATGTERWRAAAPITLKGPPGIAVSLVLSDRGAFLADSRVLRAFRLSDGRELWSAPIGLNHHKPPDVYIANGLVWTAGYDADRGRPTPDLPNMGVNGFDPENGRLVRQIPQTMTGPMGHDRCYRNRITTRYYINTVTGGSDFLDLDSGAESPNPWIRATCGIGPLPCNGLYYAGPPSCACCNSVLLNGFNAFTTGSDGGRASAPPVAAILETGPAYAFAAGASESAAAGDWPTYRHDAGRSGATRSAASAALVRRWETRIGRRASAPVIAGGLVFAADVDGHSVCALRASDGALAWRFTADGRVDSPPTWFNGLVLFGSRDGAVHCLRASDGAPAWRFVPTQRRWICAYEQPESAWPVSGSVLVRDGLAYFAAGRNSFADGGILVFALDVRTGRVVHQKHMYGPVDEKGFPIENREVVGGMSIEGFKADIFLADDACLYLRHQAFRPDLTPVPLLDVTTPHLIPSHGFLESIPQHRSFWTIDTALRYDIPTGMGGVHGDILVIGGGRFFEVRGYPPGRTVSFDPRASGYTLYSGVHRGSGAVGGEREGAVPARRNPRAERKRAMAAALSSERWKASIPLTGKAMALAGDVVFVAGTPVAFPEDDLAKAYEGRMGGVLWAASAATGEKLAEYALEAPPAWDAMAAAHGCLYLSLADGRVLCMGPKAPK